MKRGMTYFAWGLGFAASAIAADMQPVQKSVTPQPDRYTLVGVIAEGDRGSQGIAVLRDKMTEKTYTLRVGESVPSEPSLKLEKVSRNLAVLSGDQRSVSVSMSIGGSYESNHSVERQESMHAEADVKDKPEQGLFERWYQGRGEAVLTPTSDGVQSRRSERYDPVPPLRVSVDDDDDDTDFDSENNHFDDSVRIDPRVKEEELDMRAIVEEKMRALNNRP